jgi:hypothetical protein
MMGYMQVSILAALAELDLGTAILENNNSLSAAELAELRHCDKRGTEALLDVLSSMDYFTKSGIGGSARYSVAEGYKEYLDSRSPTTLIHMMRHMANGQRSWAGLSWSVKSGSPQGRQPSILGAEQDKVSFIMSMNSMPSKVVDGVIKSLRDAGVLSFGKQNPRILDIGGASGTYTEAFLKELPESSATVFDLPVAIAQAKRRFAGSAMEGRVNLVEGDFTQVALPLGYDFAWISGVIHMMNQSESRMLYAKALDALNPGGTVAVRDYVMSEDRLSPPEGTIFGINMLVNTPSGMVYTYKEIKEDLEAAGFTGVAHAVDVPTMAAVVTAKKP